MKIIGHKDAHTYTTMCYNSNHCGAILEYTENDVKKYQGCDFSFEYIRCPVCDEKVNVQGRYELR